MAAYTALVSVMQTIAEIQHHPRPPISLHQHQIASLTRIITFLQNFLEAYNPHLTYTAQADPLESRIAEAANAVEDAIESYIVDRILHHDAEQICAVEFHQALQKAIEEIDLIRMEVAEVKATTTPLQIKNSSAVAANDVVTSKSNTSTAQRVVVVGFDDVMYQMLEQICSGEANLQIIPIVGMGGIGKTTLAQNIYVNPVVEQHFDVRAWSSISQEYNALNILTQLLHQADEEKNMVNLSEDEVGEELYKYFIGRRYLVVMDDMWSIKAWDRVRKFFPNDENGSRIVITTRLSNLASLLNSSTRLEMKFLDDASSWIMFTKIVFGEGICPHELTRIGMEIVRGCKGLPLSIAVIGGLLSKTRPTRENWESIERNLYSTVNLEDNERCLQILYTSYNNLPVYLKPCFLYTGVFPEDFEIPVFLFIGLWIAEGFLKPIQGKTLEEVAEEYLEQLVDRNLILVETRNHFGKVQSCKIHDLLRDLSLREAQKVKFCCVLGEQSIHDIPQGINSQRRFVSTKSQYPPSPLSQSLESASLVRSLIGKFPINLSSNFRLLRVSMFDASYAEKESIWSSLYGSSIPLMCDLLRSGCKSSQQQKRKMHEEFFHGHVNLRFLCVAVDKDHLPRIPSSASLFWNLQTVVLLGTGFNYVFKIWQMPRLRHVMAFEGTLDGSYCFPSHPLNGKTDNVVLENLQTLATVSNLKFSEGVLERIPNIRWLELYYDEISTGRRGRGDHDYCLNNLSCLHKLDFLELRYSFRLQQHTLSHTVSFPYSLKELTLEETRLRWEDIKTKIGSLPYLQALTLKRNSVIGSEWETLEGQFSSLKFLLIDDCNDLECWMTDNTHFPCLDHLVLCHLKRLREIPLSIGDIPTLVSIALDHCSDSAVASARRILEEQEELGNEGLRLQL